MKGMMENIKMVTSVDCRSKWRLKLSKSDGKRDERKTRWESCRVLKIYILEEIRFGHKSKAYHESEC